MYKAFNVKLDKDYFREYSYTNLNTLEKEYKEKLKTLINSSTIIKAEKIKSILMPKDNFDIFISHSHKDLELAKNLAGYIEKEFGLKCFIDSLYWGNIDVLQEELNEEHRDKNTKLFDHQKTMEVAKHANMILASALTEMIDKCECIFFLNTDNSVIPGKEALEPNQTYSPWIYHEVYTVSKIKINPPERYQVIKEEHFIRNNTEDKNIKIKYDLDLSGMTILDYSKFCDWKKSSSIINGKRNLDILYRMYK